MIENCCSTSAGVLNGTSELLAPFKAENNRTSSIEARGERAIGELRKCRRTIWRLLGGGVPGNFGDPADVLGNFGDPAGVLGNFGDPGGVIGEFGDPPLSGLTLLLPSVAFDALAFL